MVFLLLSMSLGSAATTLVAQSLGQGDIESAADWVWDTGRLGVVAVTCAGAPLCLAPKAFLGLFMSDPAVMSLAVVPLQLVAATGAIVTVLYVLAYTLSGVGDGNRVLVVLFMTTWFLCLPGSWIVGPYLKLGLVHIYVVDVLSTAVAAALVTNFWKGGRWKTITV
jgi:Na+-driven multidrug efflux pump